MKKLLAVCISTVLILYILAGAFAVTAETERMIADIDKDGTITVSDALFVLRTAAKLRECASEDIVIYDVTGDKEVEVVDALGVLRSAIGLTDDFGYDGVKVDYKINEAALGYGYTQELFEKAIISEGNTANLAKVFCRCKKATEKINYVVLGGSITAGSAPKDPNNCYAKRLYDWWCDQYPNTRIGYDNVGVGATGSCLGVHRLAQDVLKNDPDFLVVEFAVNDTAADYEYYEGIIRRVLEAKPDTAILMLFMQNNTGWNVQESEIPIGLSYGIPMISYRDATNPLLKDGTIKWEDISPDDIHPDDTGHGMVASLITSFLECVKEKADRLSKVPTPEPEPLYGTRYMNATLYMASDITPDTMKDWKYDKSKSFYHLYGIWYATKRKAVLEFNLEFKELTIITLMVADSSNTGKVKVSIDGVYITQLSNNAVGSWGDHLGFNTIFKEDEVKMHKITIEVTAGQYKIPGIMVS